jgi:hypothetical protein
VKDAVVILAGLSPSIAAVIAAGVLAAKKRAGWGWFLLIAVLLVPTIRTS